MKAYYKKEKGRRLELQIAKDLRDAGLDKDARRMFLSGGAFGFESDILTSLPLKIEAKNQETWKPLEYYDQAKNKCSNFKIPIVVMSKNRLPEPLVLIGWNDFIGLLQYAVKGSWLGEAKFSKRNQLKGK